MPYEIKIPPGGVVGRQYLIMMAGFSRRLVSMMTRLVRWWRAHLVIRVIAYIFLALLIVAIFVAIYAWSPWWIDGRRLRMLSVKDETAALATDRDEIVKIIAGFAGAVAVIYTIRRHNIDRRTLEAAQQSVTLPRSAMPKA
jgi:hypothetical protein